MVRRRIGPLVEREGEALEAELTRLDFGKMAESQQAQMHLQHLTQAPDYVSLFLQKTWLLRYAGKRIYTSGTARSRYGIMDLAVVPIRHGVLVWQRWEPKLRFAAGAPRPSALARPMAGSERLVLVSDRNRWSESADDCRNIHRSQRSTVEAPR